MEEITRRNFIKSAAALFTLPAVVLALPKVSNATTTKQGEFITVWKLSLDWGYGRGPHNKTKLISTASKNAALNRWALTETDALNMNIHLCSHAPAIPVKVCKEDFMKIWNAHSYNWDNPWNKSSVRILDNRCVASMGTDEEKQALAAINNSACLTVMGLEDTKNANKQLSGSLPFTGSSTKLLLTSLTGISLGSILLLSSKKNTSNVVNEDSI